MTLDLDRFLRDLAARLPVVPPPPGLVQTVRQRVEEGLLFPTGDSSIRIPEAVVPPPRLAEEIRDRVRRTQRFWKIQRVAGTSAAAAASLFLAVSWLGWGYVRDAFRSPEDLGRQALRIERSAGTGLSGSTGEILGLLRDDPFLGG